MLDINFIRENKDVVIAGAQKKHVNVDIEALLSLDDSRKSLTKEIDDMRAQQNAVSEKMPSASESERAELIAQMKPLKETLQKKEEEIKGVVEQWRLLMLQVPNVPDVSVPEGNTDADNQEIRVWGEKPQFDFEPKGHIELMKNLDMVDFERGTKTAGFRGYFLKNAGAELSFALWQFVFNHFIQKGGFTPIIAPSLVKREPFVGTGYLPQSEEDLYKAQDEMYLAGTAEVPTMAYYMDEVVERAELPIKFFAFSPCFRREAGSYGKDTTGIVRVHEFFKFEQVVLCEASHEESVKHHEELTKNAEELLQALKLPHHVVINCSGDLGLGQVKKYDIETWVPSEGKYRETHSSSYFHDFQTRRLNTKYRDADGKLQYAHSLNNTALATPRILVPLIENYQNADGSITIPEVLRPYMSGKEKISKA